MPKLTNAKYEAFAQHFALHDNKSEAYRHAYKAKRLKPETVNVNASKLAKDTKVSLRVKELREIAAKEADEKFKIDANWMLQRLKDIDDMDVLDILAEDGSLKPIHEWPKVWRQSITGLDLSELYEGRGDEREIVGVLKKIKWPDKLKNLELLGRHVDVQAFRDRVDARVETVDSLIDELTGGDD
jgi:phage terminase small subunit